MSQDGRDTELRLALGMRGGVSLAVWIGGACAEVDQLRRSRTAADGFWGELLARSRYERVVVDVVAGASAGGLNGVLYTASQVHGFPLEGVRELWLALGGLHDLLRRPPALPRGADDGRPATPSLLDGDGFFLVRLQQSLERLVRDHGAAAGPRPSVDLQLAATLVEPVERPAQSPVDEPLTDQRFAARFHFRHLEDAPWVASDLLPPDDDLAAVTWRLALAARASSSYPVAFEAAGVRSRRPATFASGPAAAEAGPLVDMGGVFSERRGGPQPGDADDPDFVVMDGGVLDNIPLARALRAVAAAPADRPTRRFLVYLQPGAPAVTPLDRSAAARPTAESRRSSLNVVRGAVRALITSETINADIAELEQHNQAVERARVLRLGAFGPARTGAAPVAPTAPAPSGATSMAAAAAGDAPAGDRVAEGSNGHGAAGDEAGVAGDELVAMAERAWPTYLRLRRNADAVLVRRLLDDPLDALGDDPFPSSVGGAAISDDQWRSPLCDWPTREREAVEAALFRAFGRRFDQGAARLDPRMVTRAGVLPVVRIATLLVEWARHLEDERVEGAGEAKAAFYRVHRFATELLDRPRRLAWVARAAASSGTEGADAWAAAAAPAVDLLLRVPPATAESICIALRYGDDTSALSAYRDRVRVLLDRVLVPEPSETALDPVDLRPALVATLAEVAEELRARATAGRSPAPADAPTGDVEADAPAAVLDGVLRRARITAASLAALEVVCFPEFLAGLPGERRIDFIRLSAANRTPVARWFERLVEEGERQGLTWSPPPGDAGGRGSEDGLHVKLKLAGNELMNFAAFAKAEWRANDWLWGRLDAVPTLVDLLVTPSSMRQHLGGRTVDEAMVELRAVVTGASAGAASGEGWGRWLHEEVWRPAEPAVRAEVEALLRAGPRDRPTVAAIRDALVARRQWEILSEELAKPFTPSAGDVVRQGRLSPADTADRVRDYAWGLETLTRPRHLDHVELFEALARVGADALVDNVRMLRPDGGATLVGPDRAERMAERAAALLRRFGPLAARWVLAPATGEEGLGGVLRRPSLLAATLVLLAAVAVGLWGAFASPAAALATAGALLLLVVAALLFKVAITRRRRAAAGSHRAPPPAPARSAPARSSRQSDADTIDLRGEPTEAPSGSSSSSASPVTPAGRD